MDPSRIPSLLRNRKNICRGLILVVLLAMLIVLVSQLPRAGVKLGQSEFRFNWTAAFLLNQRENMYDPVLVQRVQRVYTELDSEAIYITFSPPWVALLLIPCTFLPFATAALVWIVLNVFSLGISMVGLWRITVGDGSASRYWWIGLVTAFFFSISLTTLFLGQTTIMVLVSVAAFLVFERTRRDECAGMALLGLSIKPQMVYLTIPLLALYILCARRWRIALTAGVVAMVALLALFLLQPQWLAEYLDALGTGNALNWESANLGGIILALTGWNGGKFMGVVLLPLVMWTELRYGTSENLRLMVDLSLLASVLTAPYGFSYDHVVVLIPLLSVLSWIVMGHLSRSESIGILLLLVVANGLSFYERILTPSEAYFFWVPLIVAVIYGYGVWRRMTRRAVGSMTNTLPILAEERE